MHYRLLILLLLLVAAALPQAWAQPAGRAMTIQDLMTLRTLRNPAVSADGRFLAYDAWPDRGDGAGHVKEVAGRRAWTVARGAEPRFSADGRWVLFTVRPEAIATANADRPADRPKAGAALLSTADGSVTQLESVRSAFLSGDSRHVLIWSDAKERKYGTDLEVRPLAGGESRRFTGVTGVLTDSSGTRFFLTVTDSSRRGNALLQYTYQGSRLDTIAADSALRVPRWAWSERAAQLAYTTDITEDEGPVPGALRVWDGLASRTIPVAAGRYLPVNMPLSWTDNGSRLYFGVKPDAERPVKSAEPADWTTADFYDLDRIRSERGVDVWHGEDPLIKTQERRMWQQLRNRTFRAVWSPADGSVRVVGDSTLVVDAPARGRFAVGRNPYPYQREITWDGSYADWVAVDLATGARTPVATRMDGAPSLSPDGSVWVYFHNRAWHAFHVADGTHRNLTGNLGVPFADEDHDTPQEPGGYGVAGWIEGGAEVLLYDKFDIWRVRVDGTGAQNLTRTGRTEQRQYRIRREHTRPAFASDERVLLESYHDRRKSDGFHELRLDRAGTADLLLDDARFTFIAKADRADVRVYSRETYREYPDLWTTDLRFRNRVRQTEVNPEIRQIAWGTAELVTWSSMDGVPVEGVLIKPEGLRPGQRVPVITYFYELFSDRLHEFNALAVNHRPSFPYYVSNGYAVFLPDVRYTEGQPGYSSIKYIVPGVQKLIDMGIADPRAIGLHGHSWSGYQAAWMVTRTDMFAALVTGAPVSNMTSAYGGIRWGSGMARLFQYEQQQSRIGKTLWERPDLYIENSPLFYADRINTPTLIMFGDQDDAVPWYQGIELYLAMRRLGKDVVFLQYHGEPHHPQKYANKLDYTIRMREYFDHYLKGLPAADWIRRGEAYQGGD